jgi:hypothetical protein
MVGVGTVCGVADPATYPGIFRIVAGPFTRTWGPVPTDGRCGPDARSA